MELWNNHVVLDHIPLGLPGQNELKAAEEMRNEDVQFHICKTVILSQLLSPTRNVRCDLLDPNTRSISPRKRYHELVLLRYFISRLEPALWVKYSGIGEECFVVMDVIVLQDIDPNNTVNIGGARCLFGCNR